MSRTVASSDLPRNSDGHPDKRQDVRKSYQLCHKFAAKGPSTKAVAAELLFDCPTTLLNYWYKGTSKLQTSLPFQ
jgi:hypothetical protein